MFNKRICKSKRGICSLQKKIRYTKTKEESIQKISIYKRKKLHNRAMVGILYTNYCAIREKQTEFRNIKRQKVTELEFKHEPVMLKECIEGLAIQPDGIYVDGTLGGAGHSKQIVSKLSEKGRLIGIDRDEEALQAAKKNLKEFQNVTYVHGNHDDIQEILASLAIEKVDGILLDLGVSSYQLDERNRGFSYLGENELDMRMDKTQELTARKVVNTYSEEELADILFQYGEERFARNIARNIVKQRQNQEIVTTKALVEIIERSIPKAKQKEGHPAKRTFQAIRIEVNDEIRPLYKTIQTSISCLKEHGRLCVITFHSLEDRAVKEAFLEAQGRCVCPKELPYCVCNYVSLGRVITKKPIVANTEEMERNARSKSAKLRIFERCEKDT